jgi:hypothetical protein
MSSIPGTSDADLISTIDTGEIPEPLAPARTWIFQANPNLYDIDGAIAELSELVWRVALTSV